MELCPAIRASVKASQPLSASMVKAERRRQYGSKPFQPARTTPPCSSRYSRFSLVPAFTTLSQSPSLPSFIHASYTTDALVSFFTTAVSNRRHFFPVGVIGADVARIASK